jgi:hypothetical protein
MSRSLASLVLAAVGPFALAVTGAPHAQADAVAFLINVTVRPGNGDRNGNGAVEF